MNLSLSAAGRALISIAIALGAVVLAPQVASAAVSCAYDAPNHIVNVGLNADDDLATLKRNADGTIALSGVLCGAARVDNTDTVFVKDFSNGNTRFVLDEADGLFAPGYTIDPNGLGFGEEMSFWVDLGGEEGDMLMIGAERAGASIALGSAGINLDVAQDPPGAADADLKVSGADFVGVY